MAIFAIVLFIAIYVIVPILTIYVVAHDVNFTRIRLFSQIFMGRVWLLNIIVINEIYFYICFRFMASHRSAYFNGATDVTDAHDSLYIATYVLIIF